MKAFRPSLFALFCLVLQAACTVPEPSASSAVGASQPEGVYRQLAVQGGWVLLEGARSAFGQQAPDGRLWLYQSSSGAYRLLTGEHLFERPFFASGGVFLPDGGGVLAKVNFDGEGDALYRIPLNGSRADFIADAEALGVSSIDETSFALSATGKHLLFKASSARLDRSAPDGWYEDVGRYALELNARHPETTLRRLDGPR